MHHPNTFSVATRHPDVFQPEPAAAPVELGFVPMDRIHAEFEDLLSSASANQEQDWPARLLVIDQHLRKHFEAEDQWMADTDFPPRQCHMDEHAAVLKSSAKVLAMAQKGECHLAPSFVAELSHWFPRHTTHLDSALVAWMCKLRFGGKPVVLQKRREISGL